MQNASMMTHKKTPQKQHKIRKCCKAVHLCSKCALSDTQGQVVVSVELSAVLTQTVCSDYSPLICQFTLRILMSALSRRAIV